MIKLVKLFAAFLLTLSVQQLVAQSSVGIRGGVNISNINQSDVVDAVTPELDNLTAFSIAGFMEFPLTSAITFQPELAYTVKGFSLAQGADIDLFGAPLPVGVTAKTSFDYLELPLLMKARFGNEQAEFFLLAGPSVGYALGGQVKTQATGLLDLNLTKTNVNLDAINYKRFEFAGIVGAGFAFDAGFGKFIIDGRYQHGFTQLYDIPLVGENVTNRGFAVNAGFAFPINR